MAKWPSHIFAVGQERLSSGLGAPSTAVANANARAVDEPSLNLSPAGHLLLPIAICLVSTLTIVSARYSNLIATIWPANAIMLAALLRYDRNVTNYSSIIVGGLLATALPSLLSGNSPALSLTLFIANAVEIVAAIALLSAFQINSLTLRSFRGVLFFMVLAGGVAPIPSTLISAMAFGSTYGFAWLDVWRNWYAGHALGMIIVTPFLVCAMSSEWQAMRMNERRGEAATILASFIVIAGCAIFLRPAIFIVAPTILFATVRFGLIGATASTISVAIIASTVAVMGIGPSLVPDFDLPHRIFALQMFLAITSFWALPTATLLTERDRLLGDLSRANARLAAESERKSHLVTGLRRHLAMAEENERLRLSHELHDQAGQSVIAAILELNEIDSLTTGPAQQRLHLLRKKMEEMGKTLHRIAWELRPPSIDELGLRKALSSYIADWSEQCGTDVDFHCDDPQLDEVPNEIATAVYRVVQEGLTNIVKHAQRPSDVSVVIRHPDTTLQVIVEDNGCGFDVAALAAKSAAESGNNRGLGLDGMRERLSLIGGTLDVESAVGAGTTIFARIRLDDQRPTA